MAYHELVNEYFLITSPTIRKRWPDFYESFRWQESDRRECSLTSSGYDCCI